MIRKSFRINYLPIKTYASMKVDAATEPVQEYDATTGEYYPDRTLAPLVLTPVFGYTDPNDGSETPNAAALLTDGHWYRLDNTTGGKCDSTTEITSGTKYVIDTQIGSPTYGRISIKENVLPGNPVTYIFRATLRHPNGETIVKETSWQARSRATETFPTLKLDQATETSYNPWDDPDTFTLNPILTPAVPGAVYDWETCHNSVWGALGSTHYDWALSRSGNGVTVNRAQMQDRIDIRCKVTYKLNGKTLTDTITASVVRLLPKFEYDITRLSGIRQTDSSIAPQAIIRTAKKMITDPKGEVTVTWYNAAGTAVGTGMNPAIPLSSLGSTLDLGLDIQDAGGWKALELADGSYLTDASGAILIAR